MSKPQHESDPDNKPRSFKERHGGLIIAIVIFCLLALVISIGAE